VREDPFGAIVAQEQAIALLRAAVAGDRVASAYLFEGPSGVGKQKAALALAQAVIGAQTPDEKRAEVLRRIAAGTHPDVRVFPPREGGDRNIPIATVREQILPFAQFAPFEAASAFLIFPEADVSFPNHHPESANALLKTLEEPRPGVHFVLLSERPDRLLITIRSRCQRVRFGRLPPAALEALLAAAGVQGDRSAAIALADGRADRALALAAVGAADALLESALRIDEVAQRSVPWEIVALADELAREADVPAVLSALATFYRDVAAAALGAPESTLAFRHRSERIRERAASIGAARAARACERIRQMEKGFVRHVDVHMALVWLFSELGG
jgi:DNA polymerase-3 subunit delta'